MRKAPLLLFAITVALTWTMPSFATVTFALPQEKKEGQKKEEKKKEEKRGETKPGM